MPSLHKCGQAESVPTEMAPNYSGRGNGEKRALDGVDLCRLDELSHLERREDLIQEFPTREKQSPTAILGRPDEFSGLMRSQTMEGLARLIETEAAVLAGCNDLLENWKPLGIDSAECHSGVSNFHLSGAQDGCKSKSDVTHPPILEQRYERTHGGLGNGSSDDSGNERDRGCPSTGRCAEAFDQENLMQRLRRLWRSTRGYLCNNKTYYDEGPKGLPGPLCADQEPASPFWHGYLPCPEYMENPKDRGNSDPGEAFWKLHAPAVPKSRVEFPYEILRWLSVGEFTKAFSRQISSRIPIAAQIASATCRVDDEKLRELIEKGFVSEWGTVRQPKGECWYIGNLFLRAERAKERWRLIFHPKAFNEHARRMKLHSTRLPRLRKILKQISMYQCTVKLDLKCAFFQIPIESGMFVFKKGDKLYSLNRLPMGSSVSVMVAQYLSEQVAECIIKHLRTAGVVTRAEANVYVDDIFVSFDPRSEVDVQSEVQEAIARTRDELHVTFKICQIYMPAGTGTLHDQSCPGGAKTTGTWGSRQAASKLVDENGVSIATMIETLEVLGVVYEPQTRLVKLKDEFQSKILSFMNSEPLSNITARSLWRYCGISFYAIYALGVCPSRFYWVFRTLSNQGKRLVGANKWDKRWDQPLSLTPFEIKALEEMKNFVLTFPTVVFEPTAVPFRYVFTDASNEALGVVIFVNGRIEVRSRRWQDFEASLPINSREVIAAGQGIEWACPNPNEAMYLAVDNTVAFYDIVSGKSKEIFANETVRYIRTSSPLALAWVPSELMPADGPSRNTTDEAIAEKIRTILFYTTRYVALPRLL